MVDQGWSLVIWVLKVNKGSTAKKQTNKQTNFKKQQQTNNLSVLLVKCGAVGGVSHWWHALKGVSGRTESSSQTSSEELLCVADGGDCRNSQLIKLQRVSVSGGAQTQTQTGHLCHTFWLRDHCRSREWARLARW